MRNRDPMKSSERCPEKMKKRRTKERVEEQEENNADVQKNEHGEAER